jgi:hypothetical protein
LSAIGGKIEQRVCIKFCVKLGKSATETLEMLHDAFGEHSLSRTAVFERHSHFKAGPVSVEMTNVQGDQAPSKRKKIVNKFQYTSTKTVAAQSMHSQSPLRSGMDFARRS